VDHRRGVEEGNRIDNLRLTDHRGNAFNMKLNANNTSGHRGIYWMEQRNKWHVKIGVNYKFVSLGLFSNLEDAIAARLQAEKDLNVFHREQLM
jgi:hypothetical protein